MSKEHAWRKVENGWVLHYLPAKESFLRWADPHEEWFLNRIVELEQETARLTTERDHYYASTGERRDAYNRAEEGRIKAVQAGIDAAARIAELEAALREAGRNMKLLMECEADERDCKACLARIDALLGDKP